MLFLLKVFVTTKQTNYTTHVKQTIKQIMSSNTSFDNQMSLYIPRCDTRSLPRRADDMTDEQYQTAVKQFIANQFKYQHIGNAARVDLVPKQTPDNYVYYIAFVHFAEWFDTDQARALQADVNDSSKRAKLQFHERWFWICNKNTKPLTADEVAQAKLEWEMKEYQQQQQQQHAMWMAQQQAMAQLHHQMMMNTMGYQMPRGYTPHPILSGAAELASTGFTSSPADFPPLTPLPLTRQSNMRSAAQVESDVCHNGCCNSDDFDN